MRRCRPSAPPAHLKSSLPNAYNAEIRPYRRATEERFGRPLLPQPHSLSGCPPSPWLRPAHAPPRAPLRSLPAVAPPLPTLVSSPLLPGRRRYLRSGPRRLATARGSLSPAESGRARLFCAIYGGKVARVHLSSRCGRDFRCPTSRGRGWPYVVILYFASMCPRTPILESSQTNTYPYGRRDGSSNPPHALSATRCHGSGR